MNNMLSEYKISMAGTARKGLSQLPKYFTEEKKPGMSVFASDDRFWYLTCQMSKIRRWYNWCQPHFAYHNCVITVHSDGCTVQIATDFSPWERLCFFFIGVLSTAIYALTIFFSFTYISINLFKKFGFLVFAYAALTLNLLSRGFSWHCPMGKNFENRHATVPFFMRLVPILTPTGVNKWQFYDNF